MSNYEQKLLIGYDRANSSFRDSVAPFLRLLGTDGGVKLFAYVTYLLQLHRPGALWKSII
jgi:hypothetical protein